MCNTFQQPFNVSIADEDAINRSLQALLRPPTEQGVLKQTRTGVMNGVSLRVPRQPSVSTYRDWWEQVRRGQG